MTAVIVQFKPTLASKYDGNGALVSTSTSVNKKRSASPTQLDENEDEKGSSKRIKTDHDNLTNNVTAAAAEATST